MLTAIKGRHPLEGVARYADATPDTWKRFTSNYNLDICPRSQRKQPSSEERTAVVTWIASAMRKAGHHVRDKLALPNYGNYVPHEPLFRGPLHPAPATVVRAWRVRPDVYLSRVPNGHPALRFFAWTACVGLLQPI
jgi:hypothetical protein